VGLLDGVKGVQLQQIVLNLYGLKLLMLNEYWAVTRNIYELESINTRQAYNGYKQMQIMNHK
jgi:hypothetical protein